jgi:predicted alpha-1,2-mannosidase
VLRSVAGVLFLLLACAASADAASSTPLGDLVDTRFGTEEGAADFGTGGGAGSTYPGATAPFGMVQLSPDTIPGAGNFGGLYTYSDKKLRGFSLTHISGGGCSALGDVPILPTTKPIDRAITKPRSFDLDPQYEQSFTHKGEVARPGDYQVSLGDGTRVELSATTRVALMRLRYPAGSRGSVLVNPSGSAMGNFADDVRVDTATREISGTVTGGQFCAGRNRYRLHFVARFDRPIAANGTFVRTQLNPGATEASDVSDGPQVGLTTLQYKRILNGPDELPGNPTTGAQAGAYATFDTSTRRDVVVRVGLSTVSTDGARRNLDAEAPSRATFESLRSAAKAEWERRLAKVRVKGGTSSQRRVFETMLYHALLMPNARSDVDGRYQGMDDATHRTATGRVQYGNVSGWDIYRSQVPLLAMVEPRVASDLVRSLVNDWRESGRLPKWPMINGQTNIMVGDPADAIIAGSHAFGARDFDAREALRAMVEGATRPAGPIANGNYVQRPGLDDVLKYGCVGYEKNANAVQAALDPTKVWGAASTTLEYQVADFSIARLAAGSGDARTCRAFAPRSAVWRKLWDAKTGYIRPRNATTGTFAADDDPAKDTGFVEGSEGQYVWAVPNDVAGLAAAMGGRDKARARLNAFFSTLNAGHASTRAFLGNEPTLHTPYLYDWLGAPGRGAAVVRRAMLELYAPAPGGYPGNDDGGQMASWWVLGALGFYPAVPGTGVLALGAPLFPRADVKLARGTLRIDADGAAANAPYVQSLRVGDDEHRRAWLAWDDIARGGRLSFTLGRKASSWATDTAAAPPSFPAKAACDPLRSALASR